MGLKTAMGEGSPSWQGSIVDLARSAAASVVEMRCQKPENLLSVGDVPLQSP